MAKRIVTKIGDVFCAEIDGKYKHFFQYIANDMTCLNSSVIRAFKTRYPIDYNPDIEQIVKDDVSFYAHTVLKFGIQDEAWYKVGKSKNIGVDELKKVIFAETNISEYKPPRIIVINPMRSWYIWRVNGPTTNVGKLPTEYHNKVEEGGVLPYSSILTRLKYGYSDSGGVFYKVNKRIPLPYADSYVWVEEDERTVYYHFHGQNVVRELIVTKEKLIRLTTDQPESDGYKMRKEIFSDSYWNYYNFIFEEDFEDAWSGSPIRPVTG